MDVDAKSDPGNTALSLEEREELIPNLATQGELNQWERENILGGSSWALSSREIKSNDPFTETFIRELHRRMFSETWKWAGIYRNTEKNIGVLAHEIRDRIGLFLGDARYWIDHKTYEIDEIAVRSHHELVVIHPFANGNGRHARLFADVVAVKFGRPEFTWGRKDMVISGPVRDAYLEALKMADKGNFWDLLKFSRS